jgi:hypothetical protein
MFSYLASAALAVSVLGTIPQGPQWEHDYGVALAATRAGNQPLLVVIDNPRERGARIEPALLSDDSIDGSQHELLQNYGLCRVDASTRYGRALARAFRARHYPYMAIIDKTGSVILYSKEGNIESRDWEDALTRHRNGERTPVRAVSHTTSRRPTESAVIERPLSRPYFNRSSCSSCQRW